jgi:hypothetical protein
MLYDYYDDPTPNRVEECASPQPYYFIDIEQGPSKKGGVGQDRHEVSFELPEGAEAVELRMYYGPALRSFVVNGDSIAVEQVYEMFPVRSATYVNIPRPMRWAPFNDAGDALASYLQVGQNMIQVTTSSSNVWDERPFYIFARFRVPAIRTVPSLTETVQPGVPTETPGAVPSGTATPSGPVETATPAPEPTGTSTLVPGEDIGEPRFSLPCPGAVGAAALLMAGLVVVRRRVR